MASKKGKKNSKKSSAKKSKPAAKKSKAVKKSKTVSKKSKPAAKKKSPSAKRSAPVQKQPVKKGKEFLLIFRAVNNADYISSMTQEQRDASMQKWGNWIGGKAQQGKLSGGQPLAMSGYVIKEGGNIIADGAHISEGMEINGYLVIQADTYSEAVEYGRSCPIFDDGGTVEVREIAPMVM